MSVEIVPYDTGWAKAFEVEASALKAALTGVFISLHHIGSTAVPNIMAKPIIDILGEVHALYTIDDQTDAIEAVGYRAMGEHGIEGRRYFRRHDPSGRRSHHLHIYQAGSAGVERHIALRDYLRANPQIAHAYSSLKIKLIREVGTTGKTYADGKASFVDAVETDAIKWFRRRL
ncbi:MAG: GrpB family protein [Pseudomonadota bacterium]